MNAGPTPPTQVIQPSTATNILREATTLQTQIGDHFHDQLAEALYTDAALIADRAVTQPDQKPRFDFDRALDRIVTSRIWGFPLMILLFTVVFWLTIAGANTPSGWLATLFLDKLYPLLKSGAVAISLPWWLDGLLIDGVYLATAWVISVI